MKFRGRVVSSSLIRQNLAEGNVSLAGRMLGRCFLARRRGGLGPGRGSEADRADREFASRPRAIDTPRRVRDRNVRDFERAALALDHECGQPADFRRRELTIETFFLTPLRRQNARIHPDSFSLPSARGAEIPERRRTQGADHEGCGESQETIGGAFLRYTERFAARVNECSFPTEKSNI